MKSILRIRLLALVATFSAVGFALVGSGCGRDVTGSPDGPLAANTEETSSKSAVTTEAPADQTEAAPDETDAADKRAEDKSPSTEEPNKQDPKHTGPPLATEGMGSPGGEGQGGRRQGGMMRGTERMLEQLDLTAAQKEKIKTITEEAAKQFQALRESQDAQQGSLREQFQQIREAIMKKIEAVLTPEQRAKLKKLQEEAAAQMRERMREQGGPGGQPGPGGPGGSGDRQGSRSGG